MTSETSPTAFSDPNAVSITYSVNHYSLTERTGPDGAYIVVVPATNQSCTFGSGGGERCFGGGEITTSSLQSWVITAVTYRDGHVCRLPTPTQGGVAAARAASCPNIGYAKYPPFHPPHITVAQVSTPVTPSFVVGTRFCYRPKKGVFNPIDYRIPRGFKVGFSQTSLVIHVRFVARVAADNHRSVYEFSLGRATGPNCRGSASVSATTITPIHAGQHVVLQDNESPCPGRYEGLVTYQPNGGPGNDTLNWDAPIRDHSTIVGRSTFVVR